MINKKEFKKMAKDIMKFDKGLKNPKIMHPIRDWGIGVCVGLLLLVITTVWSANTYLYYRGGLETDDNVSASDVVVYRESLVEAALESYEESKSANQDLLDGLPVEVLSAPVEIVETDEGDSIEEPASPEAIEEIPEEEATESSSDTDVILEDGSTDPVPVFQ